MDYVKECTLNGCHALSRKLRTSHVIYPGTGDVNYDVMRIKYQMSMGFGNMEAFCGNPQKDDQTKSAKFCQQSEEQRFSLPCYFVTLSPVFNTINYILYHFFNFKQILTNARHIRIPSHMDINPYYLHKQDRTCNVLKPTHLLLSFRLCACQLFELTATARTPPSGLTRRLEPRSYRARGVQASLRAFLPRLRTLDRFRPVVDTSGHVRLYHRDPIL